MPKINLDSWIGKYSATPVSEEEAVLLQKQGYVVVDISDEQLAEWKDHLAKCKVWDDFWKKLSNEWLQEHYPELHL
jgi:hypothetical protein